MASTKKPNPSTPSGDIAAMERPWNTMATLLQGQAAVRAGGEQFLPRFSSEPEASYKYRLLTSKYVNIIGDISENLIMRAFAKEVSLVASSAQEQLRSLAENDIDGEGNAMNVVARQFFSDGVNFGLGLLLISAPKLPKSYEGKILTVADEKQLGLRPMWHVLEPQRLIALRSDIIGGREEFTHVRFWGNTVEADGFEEVLKERIVVYNRAKLEDGSYGPVTWEVWVKKKPANSYSHDWVNEESGALSVSSIPLVPFITGRRKGWTVTLPLQGAADLQLSHYTQESELQNVKMLSGFPVFVGEGIEPPKGKDGLAQPIPIGPGSVLWAPPTSDGRPTSWKLIEPTAASVRQMADDVERTERQLRELGRNPLTAASGNLTVITTAFAAQKGNAAVQAWSLGLKDALERALQITAEWLGDEKSNPEVQVNSDLSADMLGEDSMKDLNAARKNKDISQSTWWREAKRRGLLSEDFNAETEKELLLEENPDPDGIEDLEAAQTPEFENVDE